MDVIHKLSAANDDILLTLLDMPMNSPHDIVEKMAKHPDWCITLDNALKASILQYCDKQQISAETLLLTCHAILLHRITGQTDIRIKLPAATAKLPGKSHAIRLQLQHSLCMAELLTEVVKQLGVQPPQASMESRLKNAIRFKVCLADDCYQAIFEYITAFDLERSPKQLSHSYHTLLENVIQQPAEHLLLRDLPIMSQEEYFRILDQYNHSVYCASHPCVLSDWEQACRLYPDHIAAVECDISINYSELDQAANRFAHFLLHQGVEQKHIVALSINRGIAALVCILGTLKTGAAYLPIDPQMHSSRLQFMLNNAKVKTIVYQGQRKPVLSLSQVKQFDYNLIANILPNYPDTPVNAYINENNLAYVMYTHHRGDSSKAVAMPHGTLANLVHWQTQSSNLATECQTLLLAPSHSGRFFQEMFSTLTTGGQLQIASEQMKDEVTLLLERLCNSNIQRLFLDYRSLCQLVDAANKTGEYPTSSREIIVQSEQLFITPAIRQFFSQLPQTRLCHQYGLTESQIVTQYVMPSNPAKWHSYPPLGKPIYNSEIFILDQQQEIVPIGVIGDLYIGKTIARGYYNQNAETIRSFIANPFSRQPALLYSTGDKACFLDNGDIQIYPPQGHSNGIRRMASC